MRTNLTDDSKIITLWPAESISRGDRSRLPFRRIWQSTQPNFSPCSQPQHFRTLQRIFSRELGRMELHPLPEDVARRHVRFMAETLALSHTEELTTFLHQRF